MNTPNHFDIPEIKSRVKIWDVIRHFGSDCPEACKAVRSPLRDEKHPSFSIYADGTMAKDHGTGDAYDVILLYQALAGCNRHEAIVGCGKLAGLAPGEIPPELSVPPPPRSQVNFNVDIGRKKGKKDRVSLRDQLGEFTHTMEDQMLEQAFLCIDTPGADNILTRFAAKKNIPLSFIRRCVYSRLIGVLDHDALREPAIAWLFYNPRFGRACKLRFTAESSRMTMWWKGRSQEHFFGEQVMQPAMEVRENNLRVMVTEGESDALVLMHLGIPALGVTGAGVIPDHRLLHHYLAYRNIGVWYDNDEAGREATKKLQEIILQHATNACVFNGIGDFVPTDMDIGDCWVKWPERFSSRAKMELDRLQSYNQPTTLD